ncbi:MAG: hypothetical protein ACRD0P_38960, partial [Stackebrandtia sp.]
MTVQTTGILSAIVSHAMASGHFERVNSHEPKNAPGNGLTAAVWVDSIGPVRSSGLAVTSGRLVFNVRLYSGMLQEPADAIDPNLIAATDALMSAYSGDFDLGGTVRCVDLLGQAGVPLGAQAGYISHSGTMYRVMTITLPVLVNDA